MDLGLWTAFALASLIMAAIPGPGVVSIVGFAVSSGRRTALASVAGMALGNAMAMTLSLVGVGAILAASALAFTILKSAGAVYLVGLGLYTLLEARGSDAAEGRAAVTPITAFATNVAVGTFHPKTIIFFAAFAPQFISPAGSYMPQAALLVATFTAIAAVTDTLYALTADRAAGRLKSPAAQRLARRVGGGVLVAAGLATALARRS